MQLKLMSDFVDYYDIWLDAKGYNFHRYVHSGMSRGPMFRYLESIGIQTVKYGQVSEVCEMYNGKVVIYTDSNKHAGEGKILMDSKRALVDYPNYLCSVYENEKEGESVKYVQLGLYYFKVDCKSYSDWRSNIGKIKNNLLEVDCGYHKDIKMPLFSIDYVHTKNGLKAIDFNYSEMIKNTEIETILTPREAAYSIKRAYALFNNIDYKE